MGEVRFDTDKPDEFAWSRESRRTQFDLTGWLVKRGIAKDAKQAEYILLGVSVVCAVMAFFLFRGALGTASPAIVPPDMLQPPTIAPTIRSP